MLSKVREFLFRNKTAGQTAVKNVFWLSAGQIGSRVFRASVIIYAARALGAEGYGVFSYVLGLAGFFTIFADIGINPILTREAAKEPDKADYYFATAFWIKIALLLGTMLLIVFAAPYFSKIEEAKPLLIFVAFLTLFDGLREFQIAFFRSKEKMELEALVTTLTNVAITLFGFAILRFFPTPQALATTYALSAGAGTIAGLIMLRRNFLGVFRFFRKDLVKKIMHTAWPIATMALMSVFMMNVDVIMLGYLKTAEEIGFYSAGQKIVQLLYTLPSLLAISLFPILSRFVGQKDKERTKTVMEKGIAVTLLVGIPVTLGGVILGSDIINFVYGAEYMPAVASFNFLILTLLTVFPGTLLGNYILAYDKQRSYVPIIIAASISNIVFNLLLIPKYGAAGSALATLITQTIYNSLVWFLAKRINNLKVFRHLKKVIFASLLMGAATLIMSALHVQVIANIVVSMGIYLGALYLMKERIVGEIRSLVVS